MSRSGDVPVTVFAPGSGMPVVGRGRLLRGQLEAHLHDGTLVLFALHRVDVKLGGATGTMIYLTSREHGATVTVDVPGFDAALREAAGGALDEEFQRMRGSLASRRRWDRVLLGIGLSLAGLFLAFVVAMPTLIGRAIDAIPRSVDREIGDATAPTLAPEDELVHDPVLDDAVAKILARLEPHVSHDGIVYRTRVLDSPEVNAFALPGGEIVICAGLLARVESAEAVAGVLAHEIAHVTERHHIRRMLAGVGIAVGVRVLLGQVDFLPGYARDGALVAAMNNFSQEEELDADTVGVRTLLAANIDPRALADVFRTLGSLPGTEMPGMLSWLSTHPEHRARIGNVERMRRHAGEDHRYEPIEGIDWPSVQRAANRVLTDAPARR